MKRLPWMRAEFAQMLARGFDPDLIEEAIYRTARAPRPSWAYLAAIIRNCERVGVYDAVSMFSREKAQRTPPDDLPY